MERAADPRIELSYDPAIDKLTIVDRAALLRARPSGPDEGSAGLDEQAARSQAELLRGELEELLSLADPAGASAALGPDDGGDPRPLE